VAYARRSETRREHLGELQTYLDLRPFRRDDYRAVAHVAIEQATGSDRGGAIVSAMIGQLRQRRILLPSLLALERIRWRRVLSLASGRTKISSRGYPKRPSPVWRPCSPSTTNRDGRRWCGCGNGPRSRRRKTSPGSSNGCKPCVVSASAQIARSVFTAHVTRRSPGKSLSSFHATSRVSTRIAAWRRSSCSRARWKRSSPTPLSPCSARCSVRVPQRRKQAQGGVIAESVPKPTLKDSGFGAGLDFTIDG
jgi:hypothetical protein